MSARCGMNGEDQVVPRELTVVSSPSSRLRTYLHCLRTWSGVGMVRLFARYRPDMDGSTMMLLSIENRNR